MKNKMALTAAVVLIFMFGVSVSAKANGFTQGDVFVSIGNGKVNEFTPTGALVQTLNDGSPSTLTPSLAFDAAWILYVTNSRTLDSTISRLDNHGTIIGTISLSGLSSGPEGIAIAADGTLWFGSPGDGNIIHIDASGNQLASYGTGTANWVDVRENGHILFTADGKAVFTLDPGTGNVLTFANNLPGNAYNLREIPSGSMAGDVLVADSANALLLDASGNILKTYNLPGNQGVDFALNLDPSGTAFWTSDRKSGEVWEVNIANGTVIQQWNSGFSGSDFGLAVYGGPTVATTPEPGALLMLGTGLAAIAGTIRRKTNR